MVNVRQKSINNKTTGVILLGFAFCETVSSKTGPLITLHGAEGPKAHGYPVNHFFLRVAASLREK